MRNAYVQASRCVGHVESFRRLCEWWTQAPQNERFHCLRRSIHGDPQAPPLKVLNLAITVAEIEHGEVEHGA